LPLRAGASRFDSIAGLSGPRQNSPVGGADHDQAFEDGLDIIVSGLIRVCEP
jgi:hypothetical protein